MQTLQFKTNINCGGCIAKVTPFLNQVENIENWKVETTNPDKILTVTGEDLTCELIRERVAQAGFEAVQVL